MPIRRPQILQVISHLDMGGAENVALSVSEALQDDFDFTFFAVGGAANNPIGLAMAERLRQLNMPVHSGTHRAFKSGGVAEAGMRLGQLLWKSRPSLVHLHTEVPETTFACAALPGLPPGLQVIRTIHNSELWPAWKRIGRVVEHRLQRARVVGVSEASLQGLRAFQLAQQLPPTPQNRTQIVYNGVAQGTPRAPTGAARPVRVLFAGRLERQKGADLLPGVLTAAAALTTRPADVTLLGHGLLEQNLRGWVETQRLNWRVRLAEPVPNLAAQLQHYDVLLLPSRFEGLCLMAIEALMAGLPVVATRVPGLTEVFPPHYPLLSAAEDVPALARSLADAVERQERYAEVVSQARAHVVRRFGLQGMASGYRAVYWNALRLPRPP